MPALLILFKATNYCIDAFTLLAHYHLFYLPIAQSTFVDAQGKYLYDLHLEHLNKVAKNAIMGLRSNTKCNNSCYVLAWLFECLPDGFLIPFSRSNILSKTNIYMSERSCKRDMQILLKQLHNAKRLT